MRFRAWDHSTRSRHLRRRHRASSLRSSCRALPGNPHCGRLQCGQHRGQPEKAQPMSEVTRILSAIEQGDPHAAEQLLPLVYDELRKLAADKMVQENAGQTLQATALVHEAYLRLVDVEKAQQWNSRAHFFGAAAEAMRRILVENARRKGRQKRGGHWQRHDVQLHEPSLDNPDSDILAIDEALTQLFRDHP